MLIDRMLVEGFYWFSSLTTFAFGFGVAASNWPSLTCVNTRENTSSDQHFLAQSAITDHQNHDLLITAGHRMAGESSISFIYNLERQQAPVSVPIDSLFFLFGSPMSLNALIKARIF